MAPALIFDLDGTLIDSAPAIHKVSNDVLTGRGYAPLSLDQIRSFVGQGAPHLVRCLLTTAGEDPEGPLFDAIYADLVGRYETDVAGNTLYPGVITALQRLQAMGCPMAITTNKPYKPALAAIAHVGLSDYFQLVIGGDSLPTRKPNPEMVQEAQRLLGRDHALYIGDSEIDAQTAQNAGLPFLIYTEGYRKTPVEDLPHAAKFSDFNALPGIVEEWTWS
ncbi:phosphoglycolate phosphatase [Rhodobacter capsulatus]|uniref:Phosphoglycolate phosphatase n=1 Tax=Rhodobacter capsulatus (strain ATCC BAA-309 / NBRC 16581 / SB1003) TaxID=272942 RepID=D5AUD2_RHOCB|nr:phosphoglycolate phosphatase [Rhodobacter capsulatus]ADE85571.1 phosphoglycolate phosphatase-3 [Rhodobacter capsulatus SB 1003]ETD01602.1 phosphoglycolate phosphatase [Rhodobacter capsulatus DE442]ETD76669.1 phosphoglycolate phosphatase [Rhodobacter capsulatus R121]ETD85992.1 phosphoglycolate phosphatase [Rhodobacter capsulatus B6]ETE53505.1 phosphoglycolate phosphatase [Rhodobacter capsulatus Y262]